MGEPTVKAKVLIAYGRNGSIDDVVANTGISATEVVQALVCERVLYDGKPLGEWSDDEVAAVARYYSGMTRTQFQKANQALCTEVRKRNMYESVGILSIQLRLPKHRKGKYADLTDEQFLELAKPYAGMKRSEFQIKAQQLCDKIRARGLYEKAGILPKQKLNKNEIRGCDPL